MLKFENERNVKCVEFDLTLSEQDEKMLIDFAKSTIINDRQALINYAVIKTLESQINDSKTVNKGLKKIKKSTKKTKIDSN